MAGFRWGRALAHRNYRLFLLGQGVSLIGTWMQQVGLTWLVYRLTGSDFLLGLVAFAGQIPAVFLSPLAGVLSDRWNRHRVLVVTQAMAMAQAVLLVVLAWTQTINVGWILVLNAFLGLINAIDMPLRQAFLSEMVPRREDLANAIALNSSLVNATRLVGPTLAGLLISVGGEVTCFLVNAASYIAVLAALLAMRDLPQRQRLERIPLAQEFREGFAYAFGFRPIRALLLQVALVSLTGVPVTVLLPVFASKLLGGDARTLGFLMAAMGVGALASALYLAARRQVLGLGVRIAVAAAVFGASLIGFSLSRQLPLSLALLAVSGFCMMLQMAGSNTLLQTIVDEDKRGRVMSLYTTAFMGIAPLGSLLAGTIADHFGAPTAVQIGGATSLAAAALFAWSLPRLREMVRPIYIRAGILPPLAAGLQSTTHLQTPPEDLA